MSLEVIRRSKGRDLLTVDVFGISLGPRWTTREKRNQTHDQTAQNFQRVLMGLLFQTAPNKNAESAAWRAALPRTLALQPRPRTTTAVITNKTARMTAKTHRAAPTTSKMDAQLSQLVNTLQDTFSSLGELHPLLQ